MRLPTHLAFSSLFWFGVSSLFAIRPEGEAVGLAALGSILPEVDTPASLVGSFARPLSERLISRFGHRALTHSLVGLLGLAVIASPLAFYRFTWWLALVMGFLSHLALDMGTLSGVMLFFPNRRRCVFPGKDRWRLDSREEWGRRAELAIFSTFFLVSVTLWPLAAMGLLGAMRYALGDIDQTYDQYRKLSASYEVLLEGQFQDNISKELFEGAYPIVDISGEGYVILVDGELRTVGKYGSYNLHPLRVHLVQGEPIRDITTQIDLGGHYIADLLPYLDPAKEHYLYGTLELEEPVQYSSHPDRWNSITGSSSTINLNLARWKDLAPYQGVRVRSGVVLIRERRKGEGEEAPPLQAITRSLPDIPAASSPPPSSPEPVPISFKVETLSSLLVKVGDRVEEGTLLGRRPSMALKTKAFALQLARARFTAGLISEAELLALEREFQEMEAEYEVRAPFPGTVTRIELGKADSEGVEVKVYLRPSSEALAGLGLGPFGPSLGGGEVAGESPFSQAPSTCPPPLSVCEQAQVLAVVDGDTIDLLIGGQKERVRLIGVDTPETKHPDKPVECFGPEASAFTAQTLDQHQVWLTYKPDERYDKYGRLLAYIWLNLDGDPEVELFNGYLVERGYARVYPFFPFEFLDEFRQVEAQARAQGLGLWGKCGYQPYR